MDKNNKEFKRDLLESLKNGLIVSCQTLEDEPIYTEDMVVKLAEAALWGGAVAIRANTPKQIKQIKEVVDLPIIGLYKIVSDESNVFITPTIQACKEVWEAGAEIIALDCTSQISHDGNKAWDLLPILKKEIPEAIIFADISNYEEAKYAIENGADIIAPTLYGYTSETIHIEEPDYREFARICNDFSTKAYVMMEGHIYTPEDAIKALYLGAHSVIVGSAITRPHFTTKRFTDLMSGHKTNWREAETGKYIK